MEETRERWVVYVVYSHDCSKYMHSIYRLDADSASCVGAGGSGDSGVPEVLPKPVFRLKKRDFPYGMCFAHVGDKLYMIGGAFLGQGKKDYALSRDVYIFDTNMHPSPGDDPKQFLSKSKSTMLAGKAFPLAFVVQGKIYVFASSFAPADKPGPKFELYDPDEDSWTALPDLPVSDAYSFRSLYVNRQYTVEKHFVVGSKIIMSMPAGMFSFDTVTHIWSPEHKVFGVKEISPRFKEGGVNVNDILFLTRAPIVACDLNVAEGGGGLRREIYADNDDHESEFWKTFSFQADNRLSYLGDNRLCLVRMGLDDDPNDWRYQGGARTCISVQTFEIPLAQFDRFRERNLKRREQNKRDKKNNKLRLVNLRSRSFIMKSKDKVCPSGFLEYCFSRKI